MLIAEDLLLLLTDDESGKVASAWTSLDLPVGGALLLELALLGRVDVTGEGDEGKAGRLVVRDPSPTGSEVLDRALAVCGEQTGRKPEQVLEKIGKDVPDLVRSSLAERGILRQEKSKVLGLFPRTTWPTQDAAYERSMREALVATLAQGVTPSARTGGLIALLSATGTVTAVFDAEQLGVSKKELRSRAEALGAGFAPEAVRKAVEAVQASIATTAAVAAAVSVSTTTIT